MVLFGIANFGLFLAFPIFCFLVRENKEANDAMFRIAPFVRASYAYILIYLFAFRGVNIKPTAAKKAWATFKYFLAAAAMVLIRNIVLMNSIKEVETYFTKGKFIQSFSQEDLIEIGLSYVAMMLGYAKLSKLPLFMTAHLWVIYYVNSTIFFQEIHNNSGFFKNDYTILHDAVISSVKKFVKTTHEPPMAVAMAGLLTFNFEIELLLVSIFNHALALMAGYWAVHNHHHPIVQQIAAVAKPWAKFNPAKLHQEIGYFAVCLVCSWHIHYWWSAAKFLARFTGRKETMKIDPWTVAKPNPKTLTERLYDGTAHYAHVVADEAAHLAHVTADGAKVAYDATRKGAAKAYEVGKHVVDDAKHVISDKTKNAKKK